MNSKLRRLRLRIQALGVRVWSICSETPAAARRHRVGYAFAIMFIILGWGLWKIEAQQSTIKKLATSSHSLAVQSKNLSGQVSANQVTLAANQLEIKREIAARHKERGAQLKAIDNDLDQGCIGRHAMADVVIGILQRSITAAKETPLTAIPGLSPATIKFLQKAQERSIAGTEQDIAEVKARADCTREPAAKQTAKAAAKSHVG